MLALAQSPLNQLYKEWKEDVYDFEVDAGFVMLTSYGEWVLELDVEDLTRETNPWLPEEMTEAEIIFYTEFFLGFSPPPKPTIQLSLL